MANNAHIPLLRFAAGSVQDFTIRARFPAFVAATANPPWPVGCLWPWHPTRPQNGGGCGQGSKGSPKWQVDRCQAVQPRQRWSKKSKLTKYLTCWIVWMFCFFPMYVYSTCCYFAMGQSTSVRRPLWHCGTQFRCHMWCDRSSLNSLYWV